MNVPQWNPPASSAPSDLPDDANSAPRLDALLPGTQLEEFEIERVLSSSGFGIVYLAVETQTERRVAIKEYLPLSLAARASDGTRVELRAATYAESFEHGRRAFIDEALLLARLDHPSLVKVLGSWHANGTAYRAMPHYPGHTLLHLRQAMDEPPDEPSLRALLEGVLGALDLLHAAGAVHGDISPANILLLPDDHPVLLDSGAARHAIVGEHTRALMMSLLEPSFAPPEQAAPSPDRPIGAWTDLYSLAAVMHYSVSGKMPPVVTGAGAHLHEPLAAVVQTARARFPFLHFSRQFAAAIDAALSPQPKLRPQSVAEFRGLLDSEPPIELPPDDAAAREASNDPEIGPPSVSQAIEPELAGQVVHDDHDDPPIVPSWRGARRDRRAWVPWAAAAGLLAAAGAAGWVWLWPSPGAEVLARGPVASVSEPAVVRTVPAPSPAPVLPPAQAPVVTAQTLPALPEAPTAAISPPQVAAPPVPALAPSVKPVAVRPPPVSVASPPKRQAAHTPASPREVCGARTQFSLYRCMQTQCAQAAWTQHTQCKLLRTRDRVD